ECGRLVRRGPADARGRRAADGDGFAVDVDAGDPGLLQDDAGAREHVPQRAGAEVLAGRELVQAHPLDEVGFGVDEGDGDVVTVQSPGEAPGGAGSGVSGSEYDDAVLHVPAPVLSGFAP